LSNPESLIRDALIELRAASLSIQPDLSDGSLRALMNKYNMLFLGKHANVIYANELRHALNTHWGHNVDISEVLAAIPVVCSSLGMSYHAMVAVKNIRVENPPTEEYSIDLF